MRWLARIHPFLFLLASLLFIYCGSAVIASPDQLIRPALALITSLILFSYPARWLARDWDGAAFLLSVFVFGAISIWRFFLAVWISVLALLVVGAILVRFRRAPFGARQINGILSATGLVFFLLLAIPLTWMLPRPLDAPPALRADLDSDAPSPDIYYIVLDGYARADILDELYQFDNSAFVESLESLGFVVPAGTHSNYAKTALSVTSTLNMDYIHAFAPGLEEYPFWWLMSGPMEHSRTRSLLEEAGYITYALASDWGITDNPTVDTYLSPRPVVLNDFENTLLYQTPLGAARPLIAGFAQVQSYDAHRELIRYQFQALTELAGQPGPKFVFAHIVSPHPPFVFDAQGNSLWPEYTFSFFDANDFPFDAEAYRRGYTDQVRFVNAQLLPMIRAILRESETPPIILLQADHGPGMFADFESADNTCLKERLSPFAAYHLPGVDPQAIPEDITPVNLFRIVFNRYFSTDLPLLENRQFYSNGVYLYRQQDVTELADTCTLP